MFSLPQKWIYGPHKIQPKLNQIFWRYPQTISRVYLETERNNTGFKKSQVRRLTCFRTYDKDVARKILMIKRIEKMDQYSIEGGETEPQTQNLFLFKRKRLIC